MRDNVDPYEMMVESVSVRMYVADIVSVGFDIHNDMVRPKEISRRDRAAEAKRERDARVLAWCREHLKVGDIVAVGGTRGYRQVTEIFPDTGHLSGWKMTRYKGQFSKTDYYTMNQMSKVIFVVRDDGKLVNVNNAAKEAGY